MFEVALIVLGSLVALFLYATIAVAVHYRWYPDKQSPTVRQQFDAVVGLWMVIGVWMGWACATTSVATPSLMSGTSLIGGSLGGLIVSVGASGDEVFAAVLGSVLWPASMLASAAVQVAVYFAKAVAFASKGPDSWGRAIAARFHKSPPAEVSSPLEDQARELAKKELSELLAVHGLTADGELR